MEKYDTIADEQLILEFRKGNSEIMDYLMVKYKSMVRKKARAMYLIGGENEDLIQEGMIGLIKAVRTSVLLRAPPLPALQNCVCPGRCIRQ